MIKKQWISSSLLMTVCSIGTTGLLELQTWNTPHALAAESRGPLSNLIFNLPEPPPVGYPGSSGDSGSRGDCTALNPNLMSLVPKYDIYNEQYPDILERRDVWGHTLSAQPTLWFSLTEVDPDMTFEVRLENKTRQEVYSFDVALPDAPGLFSVPFPDEAPTLAEGDRYRWEAIAQINCDDAGTKTLKVDGWVVRVAPSTNVSAQFSNATPQERIALLAEHGIWFDALNELIALYQPEQSAWEAAWESLMDPLELEIEPRFPQR